MAVRKKNQEEDISFLESFVERNLFKALKVFLIYQIILTIMTVSVVLILSNKVNM